ncbi:MAG TPA: DUF934 domain-containing protein [Pseudomonadaceae bacterium]|nr:DUF934 domain-containing protein [Pseudomonadaceae bacterium]
MRRLVDNKAELLDNPWALLPKDCSLEDFKAASADSLLAPLQLWLAHAEELQASNKRVGVWLDSSETAAEVAPLLDQVALVALNFPAFMDGRAYSTAVNLRQHHDYSGEIRAIGDVLRDQLILMRRCGFNSFELADSVKLEDARRAFGDFTDSYQSNIEVPQPLFRRVARAASA